MARRDAWHEEMKSNYIQINNEYSNTAHMRPTIAADDSGINTPKRNQIGTLTRSATYQISEFRRFKDLSQETRPEIIIAQQPKAVRKISGEARPETITTQQPKAVRKISGSPLLKDPLELIERYRSFRNNITSKPIITKGTIARDYNRSIRERQSTVRHLKTEMTASSETPLDIHNICNTPERRRMPSLIMRTNNKHNTMIVHPSFPVANLLHSGNDRAVTPTSVKLSCSSATVGIKISSIDKLWPADQSVKAFLSSSRNDQSLYQKISSSLSTRFPTNNL